MKIEATRHEDPLVQVRGLSKVFRDFWRRPKVCAVNNLDLDVHRGEIFGLLGPNGSGKSTTLKILLGLLHPTQGTVSVLGQTPRNVAVKRRIGYLPEESYLHGYLTPEETLDFYGKLFGLTASVRKQRSGQLLDMLGLSHAARRPVGEFSKGMARRIGLAQALINDPDLILLDEPTAGLDPIGCRQIKDLLLALAEGGKTVIVSSHLLADIEDVCDRVGILYNGRLRAQGSITDLLQKRDRLCLTLPLLSPEQTNQILALLREQVGREPDVGYPSINLEQFFLDVVEAADKGEEAASGVSRSGEIAKFLREH